ncbi:MAG: YqcI/YcgG family protein [Maritimibacter sp.]|nr:YqcI/YcgG family protein [Maritimibacter sp.]
MALISQTALTAPDYPGPDWHREVAGDLAQRLTPPSDFPCTFSQNAFRRGLVDLIFVERLDAMGRAQLRFDLLAYLAGAAHWDGQVNTARPLVVAFSREAASADSVEGYHAIGWQVLQDWLDNDPAPWPEAVATDPDAPYWSMCYGGVQLFVNFSSPAHRQRKSRNLGRHFLFIVNPRERFDLVAGDTPEGQRVRQVIRDRAEAYDGIPHAPELGSYLKGEIEWRQYGLTDDNRPRKDRCPLKMRG